MSDYTLREQMGVLISKFIELQYSVETLNDMRALWEKIVTAHEERGKLRFDDEVFNDFIEWRKKHHRYEGVSSRTTTHERRLIRIFHEYCTKGEFDLSKPKGGSEAYSLYFDNILSELSDFDGWSNTTKAQVLTCARSLFCWLMQNGYDDFKSLNPTILQKYLKQVSEKCSGSWLKSTKSNLKKMFAFLSDIGYTLNDFTAILSFPVSIKRKVLPALSHCEIASILSAVDRTSSSGKRDYAILLLAAVTGLRASDITSLKFSNIDLPNGEIRIKQQKTGRSLALPLTIDIAEAIKEYLKDARPSNNAPEIFLRAVAPYRRLQDHKAISAIYNKYVKKAGIERKAFDGKGFHSIRRSVGLNMVTAAVPVSTVAQVLGQYGIDTVKQYVPLDMTHLCECALDFSGIKPEIGGVL